MRKYMFMGDPHGDYDFVERVAHIAAQQEAEEIICLGDWGFIWQGDGTEYLSTLLARAGQMNARDPVVMRFIDGNHDNHPVLRKRIEGKDPTDGIALADHVIYQPRASTYTDRDGTRFLFVGGAPSIDKAFRIPGKTWWPEEIISEDEHKQALAVEGPIHVLVTHDAPRFPPGKGPLGDPEFRAQGNRSMQMVSQLIVKHTPPLHVHGHWHMRYERVVMGTRTVGLDCNFARLADATMLWSRDADV